MLLSPLHEQNRRIYQLGIIRSGTHKRTLEERCIADSALTFVLSLSCLELQVSLINTLACTLPFLPSPLLPSYQSVLTSQVQVSWVNFKCQGTGSPREKSNGFSQPCRTRNLYSVQVIVTTPPLAVKFVFSFLLTPFCSYSKVIGARYRNGWGENPTLRALLSFPLSSPISLPSPNFPSIETST